jgi:hypothetical protein
MNMDIVKLDLKEEEPQKQRGFFAGPTPWLITLLLASASWNAWTYMEKHPLSLTQTMKAAAQSKPAEAKAPEPEKKQVSEKEQATPEQLAKMTQFRRMLKTPWKKTYLGVLSYVHPDPQTRKVMLQGLDELDILSEAIIGLIDDGHYAAANMAAVIFSKKYSDLNDLLEKEEQLEKLSR